MNNVHHVQTEGIRYWGCPGECVWEEHVKKKMSGSRHMDFVSFTFTFIKWTHINLGAWPILGGCTPNPHSFAPISETPVYIIAYSVHVLVIQGHQNWYHSKIHMRLHTVTICLSSIVSEILRFTSAKICFFAVFTHPTLVFTLGSRVWKLASKN